MVKESFGNCLPPFLVNHYEQVYVVDQRYSSWGWWNFIQENGINELLFINNIFAANTGIRIQEIRNLMYQQYVPYVPPVEGALPLHRKPCLRMRRGYAPPSQEGGPVGEPFPGGTPAGGREEDSVYYDDEEEGIALLPVPLPGEKAADNLCGFFLPLHKEDIQMNAL